MFESPMYSPHLVDHLVHDRLARMQRLSRRSRRRQEPGRTARPAIVPAPSAQPNAHDDVVITLDGVTSAEPARR